MFYFLIFAILVIFSFFEINRKTSIKPYSGSYVFIFLIFWLVAGLRYETGVDWPGYMLFFNQSKGLEDLFMNGTIMSYDYGSQFEFGYFLLNSLLKTFVNNVQWLFFFVALITNLMLFKSVKKYSTHISLSLLLYFCTVYFILDMSGIRQAIALNLFLLSIEHIVNKNFFKYLLVILLASSFHISALILLPLYFILSKEIKNYVLIAIVGLGMIIAITQTPWLSFFMGKMIGSFYINGITEKLIRYSNRVDIREFGIGFVLNVLIIVLFIIKRKELQKNNYFNVFLNMYFVSLVLYYYAWELSETSSRLRLYFSIANVFLFTYLIDIYKVRIKRFLIFSFIIFFSMWYGRIYIFEMPEGLAYNPYQNYIVSELFKIESTGYERLLSFIYEQGIY